MENLTLQRSVLFFFIGSIVLQIYGAHASNDEYDGVVYNRVKRQNQDVGNQIIDNIFKIPISTLTAVSDLIKSTRPVVKEARRRAQEQYNQYQNRRTSTVEYIDLRRTTPKPSYYHRRSHAAERAGVQPAPDGSSFRI